MQACAVACQLPPLWLSITMPAWNPVTLPRKEADIYAIAWYVRSLMELKGTPAADELRQRLAHEPPFNPPPEPK